MKQKLAMQYDPRLLLIDMTPMGGSAATSALKAAYFTPWRSDGFLHLLAMEEGILALASGTDAPRRFTPDADAAQKILDLFQPQLIFYRPVADHPVLHEAAMQIIKHTNTPLAVWMMDDWPARLEIDNPETSAKMDGDLRALLEKSCANFAISDGMARTLEERYGSTFMVARNGVCPDEWPALEAVKENGNLKIRYAGSLAPDTALQSVLATAKAVSHLSRNGARIVFEGRTQGFWFEKYAKTFNRLPGVSMKKADMTQAQYRAWLSGADIVLLAYNFDDHTRRYLLYSFANKLPEALATGAPVLAVGPPELESIAYLVNHGIAEVVAANDENSIATRLQGLIADPQKRAALGAKGKAHAIENFNLLHEKQKFRTVLQKCCAPDNLLNEEPRQSKAQFDECSFVFSLLEAETSLGNMIDVGAHVGGSLKPFAHSGWDIWAFEPDPVNRTQLVKSVGAMDNVRVYADAVSDVVRKDVAFYHSDVSSGISGLTAFHDSHKQAGKVDTTTLDKLIDDESITQIDFLKIDVEGHEMSVIDGLDFSRIKPRAIVAEFEDKKTLEHGYTMRDLAERFVNEGYNVFVSEWHPIEAYGVRHSWRRLLRYPCEISENAWGNLVALQAAPDEETLRRAFSFALSGGRAGVGAQATVEAIAGPAMPPSLYQKAAAYLVDRHPRLAAPMLAAKEMLRRVSGQQR